MVPVTFGKCRGLSLRIEPTRGKVTANYLTRRAQRGKAATKKENAQGAENAGTAFYGRLLTRPHLDVACFKSDDGGA